MQRPTDIIGCKGLQHTGPNTQGYRIAGSLLGNISVAMCQTPSCASMAGTPHVNSQPTVLKLHSGPTSHAESSPLQMPHTSLQGARHFRQMPSIHLMHSGLHLHLHAMHDPAQAAHAVEKAGGHFGHFSHPDLHLAQCGSHPALHLAQCGSRDELHFFQTGSQSAMQGPLWQLPHLLHTACTRTT
jgi:hypothetical protein